MSSLVPAQCPPRFPASRRIAATYFFDDGAIFDRNMIELSNSISAFAET